MVGVFIFAMKTIPLTRGLEAIVDDDDFERFGHFKWHAHVVYNGFYAARKLSSTKLLYLHREILPLPKPMEVDHKNRNKLDNRKENLRSATRSQNAFNRAPYKIKSKPGASGFRGVRWYGRLKKWTAEIRSGGKLFYLGMFHDPAIGALAYDCAAIRLHRELAYLNFPPHPRGSFCL
jgi:hypothetical protein